MLTDLLPLLRALEAGVGRFHGYLCRWVDLWEDPQIGHCGSGTEPAEQCPIGARSVPGSEAIGH